MGLLSKLFNKGQGNEQQEIETEEREKLTDEEIEAVLDEEIESEDMKESEQEGSFFSKLKDGLTKTRKNITGKLNGVLSSFKSIDEELFEELEEILITSDVGVSTTMKILDNLRNRVKEQNIKDPLEVKELLKQEILAIMGEDNEKLAEQTPAVILVIGVNGVGKTTSIGKIASKSKSPVRRLLLQQQILSGQLQ